MRGAAAGWICVAAIGCQSVGPLTGRTGPATGFAYRFGTASQGFAVAPAEVKKVVVEAMGDVRVHRDLETVEPDTGAWILDGTTADGRNVKVTIRPMGAFTVVTARVGPFGDEALSKGILDRIGIRLGTLPPGAIPAEPPAAEPTSVFNRPSATDPTLMRHQTVTGYRDSPTDDSFSPQLVPKPF
jgi:hypothetical protein